MSILTVDVLQVEDKPNEGHHKSRRRKRSVHKSQEMLCNLPTIHTEDSRGMSRDVPHNLTPDARHKLSYDVPYNQVHDIHQLRNLSLDETHSLSHDEPINTSRDTLLSSGSLEEVKEDSTSGHQGRKITRRSSLMSQASVKKLFKWKNRQENKNSSN